MREKIIDEVREHFLKVDEAKLEALADRITHARRVILHGKGRVGLMMKSFAVRLTQLGLHARVIGDITAPPIGQGDLLLVGNSSGFPSSSAVFYEIARKNHAYSVCLTANPAGPVKDMADELILLYGRTMITGDPTPSYQPMCSTLEQVLLLTLDYLVLLLQQKLGQDEAMMMSRQANIL